MTIMIERPLETIDVRTVPAAATSVSAGRRRGLTFAIAAQAVVCALFLMQFVHLLQVSMTTSGSAYGNGTPIALAALAGTFLVASLCCVGYLARHAARS